MCPEGKRWDGDTGKPAGGVLTPRTLLAFEVNRGGAKQGAWPEERAGSGARADWLALRAREQEHVPELRPKPCPRCACARATRRTALFQRLLGPRLAPRGGSVEGRGLASGALVTSRDGLAPCHSSLGRRSGRHAVCIPGTPRAAPAARRCGALRAVEAGAQGQTRHRGLTPFCKS